MYGAFCVVVVDCWLLRVAFSLFGVCGWLSIVCGLVCRSLFVVVRCSLSALCCMLCVICCAAVAHCWLFVVFFRLECRLLRVFAFIVCVMSCLR